MTRGMFDQNYPIDDFLEHMHDNNISTRNEKNTSHHILTT